MTTNEMYQQLGISPEVLDFGQRVLDGLDKEMSRVDDIAEYNQAKVLSAMHKNRLNAPRATPPAPPSPWGRSVS